MRFKHLAVAVFSYNRPHFLEQTLQYVHEGLQVIREKRPDMLISLIVSDDCSQPSVMPMVVDKLESLGELAHLVRPAKQQGLIPAVNRVFRMVKELGADVFCEVQDDVKPISPKWLWWELDVLDRFGIIENLGMVSGFWNAKYRYDRKVLDYNGMKLCMRLYEGFVNLMGPTTEWARCFPMKPISYRDGKPAGFPSKGRGSDIDFNLCFFHPQSLRRRGKFVGTIRGLVEHVGTTGNSTWKNSGRVT